MKNDLPELKPEYYISTDKSRFQLEVIHDFLCNQSYWAKGIPIEIVQKSIEHSFAFGVFKNESQIGFARIITDYSTFAYLADVFILEAFRGKGLSKLLISFIIQYSELQGLRRWMLATQDAHSLYSQFGFSKLDSPDFFMQIRKVNPYQNNKENFDLPEAFLKL